MIIHLCATRFNEETWRENDNYRKSRDLKGCIYGRPKKISNNITNDSYIIVFEMLNKPLPTIIAERKALGSGGSIMGIGLIRNCLTHKHLKIYETDNYNRYLYKSKYRIDRTTMNETEEIIMQAFDTLCFKGADHIKRGKGITKIPEKKIAKYKIHDKPVSEFLIKMFLDRFQDINI